MTKRVSSIKHNGLNPHTAEYIDQLYEAWKLDPHSVTSEWRHYFYGFEAAQTETGGSPGLLAAPVESAASKVDVSASAERLITAYRMMGHLYAKTDPLGLHEPEKPVELDPGYYGLDDEALMTEVSHIAIDPVRNLPLSEIIKVMERVYCGSLATEYMHINDAEQRRWLEQRLESTRGEWQSQHSDVARTDILRDLTAAEGLEHYLHRRYVGQKRFSLEGGDSLIPMLDEIVQGGGQLLSLIHI